MRKVILGLAILALGFSAKAQKKSDQPLKFSVGVEAGLPIGDFKTYHSFGIGGSLQGEYNVAEKVGVTLNAGYLTFSSKTVEGFKFSSANIAPVLAGAKFYITEQVYAHAQLGMSFFNNGGGSAFTYAPTIGFMPSSNFDVCLKYQAATKSGSTLSFLGLRAAYTF